MKTILERLCKFGLIVCSKKTYIAVKEITFLKYVIKQGKIKPEKSLIGKIMNIQIPETKKQVQSLLGLINFYRTFVPEFAETVVCLT